MKNAQRGCKWSHLAEGIAVRFLVNCPLDEADRIHLQDTIISTIKSVLKFWEEAENPAEQLPDYTLLSLPRVRRGFHIVDEPWCPLPRDNREVRWGSAESYVSFTARERLPSGIVVSVGIDLADSDSKSLKKAVRRSGGQRDEFEYFRADVSLVAERPT